MHGSYCQPLVMMPRKAGCHGPSGWMMTFWEAHYCTQGIGCVCFGVAPHLSHVSVFRFAVTKLKDDGTLKLRPVDNFSWSAAPGVRHAQSGKGIFPFGLRAGPWLSHECFSAGFKRFQKEGSVNGHVCPSEKLCHDTLDKLALAMQFYVTVMGIIPGLLKADIDSAFRRVPVCEAHRWACGVAFLVGGEASLGSCMLPPPPPCASCVICLWQVWTSIHAASPFGATGSVHGWERIGAS